MPCSRIRWLIEAHVVLAIAPLLGMLLQPNAQMLPLLWALIAIPFGSLMTVSVWVGLGRARLVWRIAIGLAASFYLTVWPCANDLSTSPERLSNGKWFVDYLESVGYFSILLFLFSGMFMLTGLRFKVANVERNAIPSARRGFRFSMLQILVVMSIVALVLSLARASRESLGGKGSTWDWLAMNAFVFVMFLVNTVCAAFAALGPGNVKRNVGMVLIVSVVLGMATVVAMRVEEMPWVLAGSMLMAFVPTVIVLVSLLVVRSCGYRLIRRGSDASGANLRLAAS